MDASVPFEPGAVLKDVVLRFGREVIRDGEGVVTSCAPAYSPAGGLVHECRVRLRAPRRGFARGADDDQSDIDDPASVRAVLWALSDLQHDVWIGVTVRVSRAFLEPPCTNSGRGWDSTSASTGSSS